MILKGHKEFPISGKQKGSVREETNAVSGTTVMSVQNQHQKPLHPLSHQHKEVEVRREKGSFDQGKFSQGCLEVSKFMIRLLRHDDTVHREHDGAVKVDDLAEKFKANFDATSQWSIEAWTTFLAKGGRPKKSFQCCLNPYSSKHFLFFSGQSRDIQEVLWLILHCKTMYCCRMTSPSTSTTSGTFKTCTPSPKAD